MELPKLDELNTPTLPDKLEINQPIFSQDKSTALEETKTSEGNSKLAPKVLEVEMVEPIYDDDEVLLIPHRTQSHYVESNKRADDLLQAMGTEEEEAADKETDQNQSIEKMLMVEDESEDGCGAHDDDEMLV